VFVSGTKWAEVATQVGFLSLVFAGTLGALGRDDHPTPTYRVFTKHGHVGETPEGDPSDEY
jgi:hypothetical protein